MTLRTTIMETALAPLPDVCPSARTIDNPPLGRSTASSVSPLSEEAYLLILATAMRTSRRGLYNVSHLTSRGGLGIMPRLRKCNLRTGASPSFARKRRTE